MGRKPKMDEKEKDPTPEKDSQEDSSKQAAQDTVEPVESAPTSPAVKFPKKPESMTKCWQDGTDLDEDDVCPQCNFDLKKVFNYFLETDKKKYDQKVSEYYVTIGGMQ